MKNSFKPEPRPFPHVESENFINNLKQRIKRRVRNRQYLTNESYIECLEAICMDSGFNDRNSYCNILKALELQSKHIHIDENRMRCLSKEELIPNTEYFVVRGKLELEISLNNESDSRMKVYGVYMDGRYWPDDLGIYDDSPLLAKPVENPFEFLSKLGLTGEKQVYIINHQTDLEHWLGGWSGIAFLQEQLVRKNIDLSIWLSLESSIRPNIIT